MDPAPSPSGAEGAAPRHVAVIMDGNGRWAAERGLPRYLGHQEGMKAVREVVEGAIDLGIEILTLFAFSTENWERPEDEVLALMALLQIYSASERDELREKGVEVHVLGDLDPLDEETLAAVRLLQDTTAGGRKLRLNLMVSYSGRADLVRAVRSLARRVEAGELRPEEIDAAAVAGALSTRSVPDPDLLIRTSGEYRLSNFLLWELAYAEIHITPVLWPDFGRADLARAVREFQGRERRFGRVPS